MKFALRRPQPTHSWLALGGAIVLGLSATGLNHNTSQDQLAQLDVQVRAAYRMVSALVAKKDLARSAQIPPTAFTQPVWLWSLLPAAPAADMPLVTIPSSVLRAPSLHRTSNARRPTRTGAAR